MTRCILIAVSLLSLGSATLADTPTTAPTTQQAAGQLPSFRGKIPKPLLLDAVAMAKYARREVRVKDHDGKETVYSGVPLRDILASAGAPLGNHQMRGANVSLYLLAEATDGYRVVYSLAEFDAEVAERNFLVADTRDGQPLNAREGPLRIIAPDEKLQARWIRQLSSITIESAAPEKGK